MPTVTWSLWEPWYREIVSEMGFSEGEDVRSAKLLDSLTRENRVDVAEFSGTVGGEVVTVIGAGPSLERDMRRLAESDLTGDLVVVAADDASTPLIKEGVVPEVVVTDLDGERESYREADEEGSILAVHAHGDNVERVGELVPSLSRVFPTCQVRPIGGTYNFGGFTDGDRAVSLTLAACPNAVFLLGMDFGSKVGRWSKTPRGDVEEKLEKMEIGRRYLEWRAEMSEIPILNFTSGGVNLEGTSRTSWQSARDLVEA